MNFLFSSDPSDLPKLKWIIQNYAVAPIAAAVARAAWGALVATRTPYRGLDPVVLNDSALVVLGDPLVALPLGDDLQPSDFPDAHRSKALLSHFDSVGAVYPEHAAALVHIDFARRSLTAVTDCAGFVPLFYSGWNGRQILSNSPDFVEMIARSGVNPLAVQERLVALQNPWPHTLYVGVEQLRPGAVTCWQGDQRTVRNWWTPPSIDDAITPEAARQELRDAVRGTITTLVSQVGPEGALTISAGADSRYAALCAVEDGASNLTAICQTATPDLESETARAVSEALAIGFQNTFRVTGHHPAVVLSKPFHVGSHFGWDHGHFGLNALGDLHDAAFLLGGYWSDSLFDCGDMWNARREKYQGARADILSEPDACYAVTDAIEAIAPEVRRQLAERWAAAHDELGFTVEHDHRLANIFPATRSLAAGHVAMTRATYPDYQIFMTRSAVDLAFRLSAEFKQTHGKRYLLATDDQRLSGIPINPGSSQRIRRLIKEIRADIPPALWPDWVQYHGSWRSPEGKATQQLFRTARRLASAVADAAGLPVSAVPFRRNLQTATLIFQLHTVLTLPTLE